MKEKSFLTLPLVALFVLVGFFFSACSSGWTYVNWDKVRLEAIQKAVDEGH